MFARSCIDKAKIPQTSLVSSDLLSTEREIGILVFRDVLHVKMIVAKSSQDLRREKKMRVVSRRWSNACANGYARQAFQKILSQTCLDTGRQNTLISVISRVRTNTVKAHTFRIYETMNKSFKEEHPLGMLLVCEEGRIVSNPQRRDGDEILVDVVVALNSFQES